MMNVSKYKPFNIVTRWMKDVKDVFGPINETMIPS